MDRESFQNVLPISAVYEYLKYTQDVLGINYVTSFSMSNVSRSKEDLVSPTYPQVELEIPSCEILLVNQYENPEELSSQKDNAELLSKIIRAASFDKLNCSIIDYDKDINLFINEISRALEHPKWVFFMQAKELALIRSQTIGDLSENQVHMENQNFIQIKSQNDETINLVLTYSAFRLIKEPELKKQTWSDIQQVMSQLNVTKEM